MRATNGTPVLLAALVVVAAVVSANGGPAYNASTLPSLGGVEPALRPGGPSLGPATPPPPVGRALPYPSPASSPATFPTPPTARPTVLPTPPTYRPAWQPSPAWSPQGSIGPGSAMGHAAQVSQVPVMPTAPTARGTVGGYGVHPTIPHMGYAPTPYYAPTVPGTRTTIPTFGTGPGPSSTAVSQKPFSDYSPRPVISPYINLYRADTNLGTISNYYTLVRPIVQQRDFNQQAAGQIRSLQSTTRTQGAGIQQLDQRTQWMQGTTRPQPYGNYHGYFLGSPQQ